MKKLVALVMISMLVAGFASAAKTVASDEGPTPASIAILVHLS